MDDKPVSGKEAFAYGAGAVLLVGVLFAGAIGIPVFIIAAAVKWVIS